MHPAKSRNVCLKALRWVERMLEVEAEKQQRGRSEGVADGRF